MHPKIRPIRDGVTFLLLACSKELSRLRAGFPSPADDYAEEKIDLVQHPAATFPVRVDGDSMTGAGIYPGDIAIVDRSLVDSDLKAMHNKIVLAVLDGEFTIKRLSVKGKTILLVPEHDRYEPIIVSEASDFTVWGVVKHSIRHL
ncbi:MAG TPA: translesion error-prone DNA polymerase V autoproteolytic subunit [Verrucomicrobiae bacterium]|jgi:DNA polymerase V|nr:translesion error-prone DNA polymerase V autoproteolytic subunit [Verrucomicrobiae bacterium]